MSHDPSNLPRDNRALEQNRAAVLEGEHLGVLLTVGSVRSASGGVMAEEGGGSSCFSLLASDRCLFARLDKLAQREGWLIG